MDISIIIVNYKTYELTAQCIESIYKWTSCVNYEIIVVDNHSCDNSVNKLRESFSHINVIENEDNLGFGKANNVGASVAKGKYLLLLNSDTILVENSIFKMYGFLENHNEYVACGCNLVNREGEPNISYGNLPTLAMEFYELGLFKLFPHYYKNKLSAGQTIEYGDNMDVGYISGADILIKRDIFNQMGGFDDNIFMYFEETELFARMHNYGMKSCVLTDTSIIHLEGGSVKKTNVNKFSLMEKSRMYYYRKMYSKFLCIIIKIIRVFHVLVYERTEVLNRLTIVIKA